MRKLIRSRNGYATIDWTRFPQKALVMRVIIAGLGVQGEKRQRIAGPDCVATVDPFKDGMDYKSVEEVPLGLYDAALCCVPDRVKPEMLTHLLSNGKHVLVEKPLLAIENGDLDRLADLTRETGAICYTAYNHRFEPHFIRMRDLIQSGDLGKIYSVRMFYGNGTARMVRESAWRDKGAGVLPDLGSHLLDTLMFWFGSEILEENFSVSSASRFENRSLDHVTVMSRGPITVQLEMTLLMWRNHFTCDILAENGTAHIESLCKWGPSTFTHRVRVLPSGRPPEVATTLVQTDPTWQMEYDHFVSCCESGIGSNIGNDILIDYHLNNLIRYAMES